MVDSESCIEQQRTQTATSKLQNMRRAATDGGEPTDE